MMRFLENFLKEGNMPFVEYDKKKLLILNPKIEPILGLNSQIKKTGMI